MTVYISLVLSVAAFAFTLFNWQQAKERDQRDLFLKMHERMIDPELARGRGLLINAVKTVDDVAALSREDNELAREALASLDVLGMYVRRGYISSGPVMDEWGRTLAAIRQPALRFIEHRANLLGWMAWPNLRELTESAQVWVAKHQDHPRWAVPPPEDTEPRR